MKNVKLIALDMDGVVNSNDLIQKWIDNKFIELEKQGYTYVNNEIRKELRRQYNIEFDHCTELIFPELAKRISKIEKATDCYILWTSSWRCLTKYYNIDVTKDMFNRHNLPGNKLIGYTQDISRYDDSIRGNLIRCWLKNNTVFDYNDLYKCAVIDDRIDAGEGLPEKCKFFKIDPKYGITEKNTKEIIEYLNS